MSEYGNEYGYDGYNAEGYADPNQVSAADLDPTTVANVVTQAMKLGAWQQAAAAQESQQQQQALEALQQAQKNSVESDKLLADAYPQWNHPQPLGDLPYEATPAQLSNNYLAQHPTYITEDAVVDPQYLAIARYKAFELAEAEAIERLREKKQLDDEAAFDRIKAAADTSWSNFRNGVDIHGILDAGGRP
jgi:hypothetical protein